MELRTHGITRDTDKFQNTISFAIGQPPIANSQWPNWYMEMQSLGYNYRISDINCALGLSQLQRAEDGLKRRQEIASRYYQAFKNIPQITDRNHEAANRQPPTANSHAYHLYVIEAEDRSGLYYYLREQNIFAQIHYIPCHLMPYYREQGWKEGDLLYAEAYYAECISLPMYPKLTDEEQSVVIQIISDFYFKLS
jgi:dTDP-4-amino-4,6-dideoxygalactose transaminase